MNLLFSCSLCRRSARLALQGFVRSWRSYRVEILVLRYERWLRYSRRAPGTQNPAAGAEVTTSVCIGASSTFTTLSGPDPVLPFGSATIAFASSLTGRLGAPAGHRAVRVDPDGLMSRSTIT